VLVVSFESECPVTEDALLAVKIELERLFGLLSNRYHGPDHDRHAALLNDVEARLKETVKLIEEAHAKDPPLKTSCNTRNRLNSMKQCYSLQF
jgi:hypothetical protein